MVKIIIHTESECAVRVFASIYFKYAGIISLYSAGYTEHQNFNHGTLLQYNEKDGSIKRHHTVYRDRRNPLKFDCQQGYGCIHRQRDWRLTDWNYDQVRNDEAVWQLYGCGDPRHHHRRQGLYNITGAIGLWKQPRLE